MPGACVVAPGRLVPARAGVTSSGGSVLTRVISRLPLTGAAFPLPPLWMGSG